MTPTIDALTRPLREIDPMQLYGHKLSIAKVNDHLVATCECGRWRRALPTQARPLETAVAVLAGKHERHLGRIGRPPDANQGSVDGMPTLPSLPNEEEAASSE